MGNGQTDDENWKKVIIFVVNVCHENRTAVVRSWFATLKEMVEGPPQSVNKHWLQTTSCCSEGN